MRIAIGTATGNIGSSVAKEIAKTNNEIVLLGRDLENLKALNTDNAILKAVDITNADQVILATENVDVLFWMVPPIVNLESLKEGYMKTINAGVMAVTTNKIKRVVLISSIGAQSGGHLGTISYVGELEKAFNEVTENVMSIRPGYFMENFLLQKEQIINDSYFTFPFSEKHDMPFISTDDIGSVAAKYLIDEHWTGHKIKNILGPKNLTLLEIAALFSKVLRRPIRYEQSRYEDIKIQFANMGFNETIQQEFYDLFRALGDENGIYSIERTKNDFTPTTFEAMIAKKMI